MALLAYEDPETSPMFHLLSSDYRQQVADNLNRTILGQFFFFPPRKSLASCCDLYKLQVLTRFFTSSRTRKPAKLHTNGKAHTAGDSCKTILN